MCRRMGSRKGAVFDYTVPLDCTNGYRYFIFFIYVFRLVEGFYLQGCMVRFLGVWDHLWDTQGLCGDQAFE